MSFYSDDFSVATATPQGNGGACVDTAPVPDEVLGLETDDVVLQYGLAAFVSKTGAFSETEYYFSQGAPGISIEVCPRWFLRGGNDTPDGCKSGVLNVSVQHAVSLGLLRLEVVEGSPVRAIPTEKARSTYLSWFKPHEIEMNSSPRCQLINSHSDEDFDAKPVFGFEN